MTTTLPIESRMADTGEANSARTRTGLVVLGMHRSGTSVLAGALRLCGAWLGEDSELTSPNFENPKGFWERRDIRAVCDQLLHAAGAEWWKVSGFQPNAIPHAVTSDQGRAFSQVVTELEEHGIWAIKEPRLCLLFSVLRPFIFRCVCLHVYRNPLEVAQSLRFRNGFGVAEGIALWESYNRSALQASARLPRFIISYESLVLQPEATLRSIIHELSQHGVDLKMPSTEEIEELITPTLYRQRAREAEAADFLSPDQLQLWSQLQTGEALRGELSQQASHVTQQYLRDLESRTASVKQLTAKAKTNGDRVKALSSKVKALEARIRALETELTERSAESRRLTSQLESQQALAKGLESALAEQAAKASELAAELKAKDENAAELAAELKAQDAQASDLRTKLEVSKTRIKKLEEAAVSRKSEAKALRSVVGSLETQLSAVYASNSWRITAPLRVVSLASRKLRRVAKGALRVLWWLCTGRFSQAAAVLLPRYRRHMPPAVKRLVPSGMRRAVTKRLEMKLARAVPDPTRGRPSKVSAEESEHVAGIEAILSARVANTQFGRELQQIANQKLSPNFAAALQKSEARLAEIDAQLQSLRERPLVSIIMATHDRAEIVGSAIASALEQEYPNWELLVCDDGSTDDTEAVVNGFCDSRINYFKLPKGGAPAARNAGLRNARGSIIAYLDSDNFWHPAFLSAVVVGLSTNPGRSSAYTDFVDFHVDSQGRRKVKSFKQRPFNHERLLKKPYIDLNAFVHRRELYECFGGFDERLTRRQDYDLILKYTWLRDPLHIPCLASLYQRNDSLTQITSTQRDDLSCISIIDESVEQYLRHGLPRIRDRQLKTVTILSWDVCRNHFSKPFSLAEALSEQYDVQLISFRFFPEEIFPPLRGVEPRFETLYLPGGPFPEFFESMAQALAAIRGDVIYVVKPRLPSLGLALLANYRRGTPIMLEINDLETVVSAPSQSDSHQEASLDSVDLCASDLLNPYSDLWSQLMHPLAKEVPVLLTHNHCIDEEFGRRCLYMRNPKDERIYDPAAYDRDEVRNQLGFEAQDRVILFGGLLRKHKGVYELVELVERLDDPRYKLLFVGSRTTPDQKKLVERFGDRIRILPPQGPADMARINYAADLVVLWLDPDVPASHYQMPYKATDALAMGPAIIANEISDLASLATQGYLRVAPFGDWQKMTEVVRDIFENADQRAATRDAARRLFLRQFSYQSVRGSFEIAAERAVTQSSTKLPLAKTFAQQFNRFYRAATTADRDFVRLDEPEDATTKPSASRLEGYGDAEEDGSIIMVDVSDLSQLSHGDPSGVAVVMPSIDPRKGLETARILVRRAGIKTTVFVVEDSARCGFVRTLNDTATRLDTAYLVYVAEDAFPGIDWLKIAYQTLERTDKGLLAFNDGKWHGRIAGFGMVRMDWAKCLYRGPILFPGYRAHKADNELTVIARVLDEFVYEPNATLVELDPNKAFDGGEGIDGTKQTKDRTLFYERFHAGFDGQFPWGDLARHKDEYLNLRKLRAESGESFTPLEDAVQLIDIKSIGTFSWSDPEGIAVVIPCVDRERGLSAARLLVQRAGIAARVLVVEDSLRQGFIKTFNDTAARLDVEYVVYAAEDSFPGVDWLKIAHEQLERSGKGLLAFNCGKWYGRIAAFGMVRKAWVKRLYGGPVFYPGYRAHKADNELTVIARVTDEFVYDPDSLLIENDAEKVFEESVPEDKAKFHERFRTGFDGRVDRKKLKSLAKSYFVPFDPAESDSASISETHGAGRRDSLDVGTASVLPHSSDGVRKAVPTSLRAWVLEKEKGKARQGEPELAPILDALKSYANEALERGPYSVVDKTTLPPSGDPRDYWHPAPYWWPNPATTNGLPYIRKDGERVPGTRMYEPDGEKYDRSRLQRLLDDSLAFGLASFLFGDKLYAEAGARMLERFFVDPNTRMKPHLKYAQVRIGHNDNRGNPSGLIEMKDLYYYLDAVRLFESAGVLSSTVAEGFHAWLEDYIEWLLFSDQGRAERTAVNNHGTCYDLQVASIAAFLGNEQVVYDTLARAQARVAQQFGPNGCQPHELARKTTAHYCCFNLQSWINLAELASRWGVDLWSYETREGIGLKRAARWLIAHMDEPWPYEQIDAFDRERFVPIWFAVREHLDDLEGREELPECAYDAKPVFIAHDGIRPFWNLASYGAASLPAVNYRLSEGTVA